VVPRTSSGRFIDAGLLIPDQRPQNNRIFPGKRLGAPEQARFDCRFSEDLLHLILEAVEAILSRPAVS